MNNKVFFAVGILVLGVIFGPFCVIWALDQLFPALTIQYSWTNWLAINVLSIAFKEGTHLSAKFKTKVNNDEY